MTLELRYVCGSDGKTYPNHRSLEVASCLAGGAIKKVKDGKCKSYCCFIAFIWTFSYIQATLNGEGGGGLSTSNSVVDTGVLFYK